jgi:RNA polymerase sigma-70 factor (family 1)
MRNYGALSEENLLVLFQQQDENIAAFEEVYNRFWSVMYSAAYRRIQSRETAQEIVQDVFTSLWVNKKTLQVHTTLTAYLLGAVKNKVLNHIEKEMVRRNYRDQLITNPDPSSNDTEETVLYEDLNKHLLQELTQLPPKCREVFELSRKEFKTNKEIAAQLGISEKTVEKHLTKAIRLLRSGLREIIALLVFWQS